MGSAVVPDGQTGIGEFLSGEVMATDTGNVVAISDWLEAKGQENSTTDVKSSGNEFSLKISDAAPEPRSTTSLKPVSSIYPALGVSTGSALGTAVRLLDQAEALLQKALRHYCDGEFVNADNDMQHLHQTLRELFCCRDLGDGFGGLVNALEIALTRRKGEPLDELQIRSILEAIRCLQAEPFLPIPQVVAHAKRLTSAGLLIDPPGLEAILENEDEESSR